MTAPEILAALVGFPSVAGRGNGAIVDWIAAYLRRHGIEPVRLAGPEGDRDNLFASFGPKDRPGLILSAHMDVVPAEEEGWHSDPFVLHQRAGAYHGRGACDMKGFLACLLEAVPFLASAPLVRPVHLALSYDEELGCKGVPHLIDALPRLCATPELCLVGEPTGLQPVLAHKGKAALSVTFKGRAGHSAQPDLGRNAIHAALPVLQAAVAQEAALHDGNSDERFDPPRSTLQVGVIAGGRAVNIIPDHCRLHVEARSLPGVDPLALLEPVRRAALAAARDGIEAEIDLLSHYPGLSAAPDGPAARLLRRATGSAPGRAVSYGTEAGCYAAAGIPSIVCGPGDMTRAHKANEYILDEELQACSAMLRQVVSLHAL